MGMITLPQDRLYTIFCAHGNELFEFQKSRRKFWSSDQLSAPQRTILVTFVWRYMAPLILNLGARWRWPSSRFTPWKNTSIYWTRGWVSPTSRLDCWWAQISPTLAEIRFQIASLYASQYIYWANPDLDEIWKLLFIKFEINVKFSPPPCL